MEIQNALRLEETLKTLKNNQNEKPAMFRLTIETDAAGVSQIADALELQGRLHLCQFDAVYVEVERGAHTAAQGVGKEVYGEADEGRFRALMATRDVVKAHLYAAEAAWRALGNAVSWKKINTHLHRRERRAYYLWKAIPHDLALAEGREPGRDRWTGGQPGVTVRVDLLANVHNVHAEKVDHDQRSEN